MMHRTMATLARAAWLLSGGLASVVAVAFAARPVSSALERWWREAPSSAPSARKVALPGSSSWVDYDPGTTERRLRELLPPPSATVASPEAGPPAPINVSVMVNLGAVRSEVYIDGRKRGLTPFIGELTCVPKTQVRVEVLPPRGLPLAGTLECQPGVLRFGPAKD